jgi:hypothetical protein
MNQKKLVKRYRSKSFKIFLSPFSTFISLLYFFIATIFSKKTVIHLKKRNPKSFQLLKKFFNEKLILITDLEGDEISEKEYLLQNKKVNEDIVNAEIQSLIKKERIILAKYDIIFVQNEYFKRLLDKRHPQLKTIIKVSHLMSFQKGSFCFNEKIRNDFRLKLNWEKNHIITYIGNVFYPWQNISKTMKIYKIIKDHLYSDAKLLLLIRKADHSIARGFIRKHGLKDDDYILNEVNHEEINGYLNASDIGVVLRDFHVMNKVVTSGKILDYLGSGLPVITTSVFEKIASLLKERNYGVILDNFDINEIPLNQIRKIINLDFKTREEISVWANNNLSLNASSVEYVATLKKLR